MTDKREFEIVYDTELPGTPERVWEAVTKGTPASGGRKHRLVVALHPVLKTPIKPLSAKEQDND